MLLQKGKKILKPHVIPMTNTIDGPVQVGQRIPSQAGQNEKYLQTDGVSLAWATSAASLPSQSGQNGKFLTTDGSSVSWGASSGALPASMAHHGGSSKKRLRTNDSTTWEYVDDKFTGLDDTPANYGTAGQVLQSTGSTTQWVDALRPIAVALAGGVLTIVNSDSSIVTTNVDSESFTWKVYAQESNLPSASTFHGMFAHVHGTGYAYYAHSGTWHKLAKFSEVPNPTGNDDKYVKVNSSGNGFVYEDSEIPNHGQQAVDDGAADTADGRNVGKFLVVEPSDSSGEALEFSSFIKLVNASPSYLQCSVDILPEDNSQSIGVDATPWERIIANEVGKTAAHSLLLPAARPGSTQYLTCTSAGQLGFATPSSGVTTLPALTDVSISSPSANQILQYNGTNWVNTAQGFVPTLFRQLVDYPSSTGSNGQILQTNGSGTHTWVDLPLPDLHGLSDVSISSLSANQILHYNGTNWVNTAKDVVPTLFAQLIDYPSSAGSNGQILQTNGSGTHTWVDLPLPDLHGLSDVSISSLSANQMLQYNGTNWVNITPAAGVTTFTGLTDTPSSYTANHLLAVNGAGNAVALTSNIQVDGAGVSVAQLNAQSNGVSNIGDNSHVFNMVWCNRLRAGGAGVEFVLPTTAGTAGQLLQWPTSGNSLVWGALPTPTYPKVDARSQSGSNLTLQNTNGTTSTISADGILWGSRFYKQIIENTLYTHRDQEYPDPNAISWSNGVRYNETIGVPYTLWPGGHIIYSWLNGYQYRFNAIYFIRWYNTRFNWDFGVYGSDNKLDWTQLGTFNLNSTANFTDGKSSSTQTLGGTSISFAARTANDAGIYLSLGYGSTPGNRLGNHIERFTFANDNYYRFYMLKHIGPSAGLTLGASMNAPDGTLNSMNEIEWG